MSRPVYKSPFAEEMYRYLDSRTASGFKESCVYHVLKKFDRFCCEEGIAGLTFTEGHAARWIRKGGNEATTSHYHRINSSKLFLLYLSRKGYDVSVIRDVRYRPTEFQPHIYTEDECRRYFHAVDTYSSPRNRKDAIQYPVFFRILYSCGTRLNETLGIRKRDVDLEEGIIRLFETKNKRERYIVLGDGLNALMNQFADKCFYLLVDDDWIFTGASGKRMNGQAVYRAHRIFLGRAGIPYVGGGTGPRVHDWRHHMAVQAFRRMAESGLDMYVALPILSAYLGHKTIFATERYVRLSMQIYPHIEEKLNRSAEIIFGGGADEID